MLQEQTLPVGATIQDSNGGRYIIDEIVGRGGFSAVYLVRDWRSRQKLFALKEIINPDSQERRQALFEAELLKRLIHRSLPHVYQVFEDGKRNRIYILMDFIDGKNLESLRCQQPAQRFSLALTLVLLAPIVEAVSYLHKQETPVIHRDIKPANIIIPVKVGDAVLVDFGLAKEYVQGKTTNIFRYGTPGYAAPEQYGQGTNQRTDVYALGATLYTLLTGIVPVDALTRTINQHIEDPLLPANLINPDIPPRVSQVIEQAMSLRSEQRYDSVEHFWHTLSVVVIDAETSLLQGKPAAPPFGPASLPPLSAQDVQVLATTRIPEFRQTSISRTSHSPRLNLRSKPARKLLPVVIVLLLLAIITGSLFLFALNKPRPASTIASGSNQRGQRTAQATPATLNNPYPLLVANYEGTIYDLGVGSSRKPQPMYLNNIQQKQDSIKGIFHGLGLTLPFEGKVTKDQKINFHVFIAQTSVTLIFDGNIKVGGDIAGGFQSQGPDGQNVQEFGPWNVRQAIA